MFFTKMGGRHYLPWIEGILIPGVRLPIPGRGRKRRHLEKKIIIC
jgi:hypothetical protein